MKLTPAGLRLAATDVGRHLACRHLTALDLAVALGRESPPHWRDPDLEVLEERGLRHERAYLDHLRRLGRTITELRGDDAAHDAVRRTHDAMRAGADVIVQATLAHDRWFGRADVLLRVERPSELGLWSYEVVDTKLARETRAATLLQLCLYSELVGAAQGLLPRAASVVTPHSGYEPERYELHELIYYYRYVKRRLERAVDVESAATYPEPVPHCDVCRWWQRCDTQWRCDDHLSLVAGISRLQMRELATWPVTTLEALAELPLPLAHRPRRGAVESYVRVREQARIQLDGRRRNEPVHELLAPEPLRGLARLPAPDRGDLFLDFEGDPFAGDTGREYLFGCCDVEDSYEARWALTPSGERAAFEWLVDRLVARCASHPDAHFYHFAPYEPAALRRLMGRHATREAEVDSLLRAERFVDLHSIVKQSLRASVERYSIKDLEAFYGYARAVPLREASARLHAVEHALELDEIEDLTAEVLEAVGGYNADDCRSALRLRDWLERLRDGCIAGGQAIERPLAKSGDASERITEQQRRIAPVKAALLRDLPLTRTERSDEQQARWLIAELLDWHGRESKAPWWEYFRLRDLGEDELMEERSAIAGLAWIERDGGTANCPIDRYGFPAQNTHVREGNELHMTDGATLGTVVAIDIVKRTVDVKKRGAARDLHPSAVFAHTVVTPGEKPDALLALGAWITGRGIDADGEHRAARDLLLRRPPRLRAGAQLPLDVGDDLVGRACRLVLDLDRGVLPIQGPPGSGKTYTGARMICALVRAGLRVGVTAVSHKVIRNLLCATLAAAREQDLELRCVEKVQDEPGLAEPGLDEYRDNEAVRAALAAPEKVVAGGTAWLWSRSDFNGAVDVLFVDEAGQMALADVLAAMRGARSLVLLGDPQQLEQPQQGSHPEGTNVSALEHLLAGAKTLPAGRGLFLERTWRLHPALCAFTSELFYDGRLLSQPGMERQRIGGETALAGAGLWFSPVDHEGNQSSSPEEVERVSLLVTDLVRSGVSWIDSSGRERPVTLADVLVVAPYNAQVADLSRRLQGARVGTVDKFQGQEAPVVIYSMTTSTPEDAPRGMEFLYSSNRLNVATSRARCACILVASPRLLEPECRRPEQMRLANAFCRYLELASTIAPDPHDARSWRIDRRV
jgi:uncharacterized protein